MQAANETDRNAVVTSKGSRETESDPLVDDVIERYFQALLDQTEVPEELISKLTHQG